MGDTHIVVTWNYDQTPFSGWNTAYSVFEQSLLLRIHSSVRRPLYVLFLKKKLYKSSIYGWHKDSGQL
jgi:hypothetical protein